jgi:hypothetical protein
VRGFLSSFSAGEWTVRIEPQLHDGVPQDGIFHVVARKWTEWQWDRPYAHLNTGDVAARFIRNEKWGLPSDLPVGKLWIFFDPYVPTREARSGEITTLLLSRVTQLADADGIWVVTLSEPRWQKLLHSRLIHHGFVARNREFPRRLSRAPRPQAESSLSPDATLDGVAIG